MTDNITQMDNMPVRQASVKTPDPLGIAYNMKRRPSYVQSFCILQCVSMSPKVKIYQVARMLGFDYYQAMKRVMELSKKGFIRVVNGSLTVTNEGIILKEILAQLIALLHSSDVNAGYRKR